MEGTDFVRMLLWGVIIAVIYGGWKFKKRMGMTTREYQTERQDEVMRLHEADMKRKAEEQKEN